MTSSLVGSEMCIRDRSSNGIVSHDISNIHGCNRPTKVGTTSSATCRTLLTVSYTHLTLPTICSV
eukprot:4157865-Prorocentrum_lima.AAC.1